MSDNRVAPEEHVPDIQQLDDDVLAKLSPGALRRVLLRLRNEDELAAHADHDSHVMFGSHESHGSHGQHTSHSSSV